MSWQSYVDTQMIDKKLKKAAIAGMDGSIWAKSNDFNLTSDEVKTLLGNYNDMEKLASSGINLGGQKYLYLSGNEEVVRGKQGKGGVHIMKTNMAVLVGVYDDPMQPPEAATITEGLGSYLKGCGY
eukprot:TRINITY_DN28_c0_g1_i1.p1 TRINITY_DN28_c0_g1~~TRINITY_DN28_c0_g1_i1.p1  ORF type:complete len:126 (+),score=44.68 TRINITY_DN28_c0_g1_i1:67-444(+)